MGVQAGVILQDLEKYLFEKQSRVCLDVGARSLCQIGGVLATNAVGIRFVKTNNVHAALVGLKVILANGDVFDSMTTIRKDSTGYDLK